MSPSTTPLPSFLPQKEQPQLALPPRSSTHPVKPRHHIPHHPHRVHHKSHHHRDKSVPQSAIQPSTSNSFYGPSSFGDFVTKTATASKADGGGLAHEDAERSQQEKEETEKREREKAQWIEVEKLRTKRKAADDDLRTTLTTLSTLSTATTRRLDYAYYALLSSVSSLTTTLASLHTLSTSTRTLATHFATSTSSLSSEIKGQVVSADRGFKQQARRISDLEARMKKGREKVQGLGQRLEAVRVKVERSEERDREGRMAVGRRLKMLWGILGVWGFLVVVLLVIRHWPNGGVDVENEQFAHRTRDAGDRVVSLGREQKEKSRSEHASRTSPSEDPILRLLDEL